MNNHFARTPILWMVQLGHQKCYLGGACHCIIFQSTNFK